jgi:hypothetical protein
MRAHALYLLLHVFEANDVPGEQVCAHKVLDAAESQHPPARRRVGLPATNDDTNRFHDPSIEHKSTMVMG